MKPITPQEVVRKVKPIPPEIIEAFNDLIRENISGNSAKVLLRQAISRIAQKTGFNEQKILRCWWLDNVEPIFREAGWDVTYRDSHYYESYYLFTVKK
jgi:hypothetical protein